MQLAARGTPIIDPKANKNVWSKLSDDVPVYFLFVVMKWVPSYLCIFSALLAGGEWQRALNSKRWWCVNQHKLTQRDSSFFCRKNAPIVKEYINNRRVVWRRRRRIYKKSEKYQWEGQDGHGSTQSGGLFPGGWSASYRPPAARWLARSQPQGHRGPWPHHWHCCEYFKIALMINDFCVKGKGLCSSQHLARVSFCWM